MEKMSIDFGKLSRTLMTRDIEFTADQLRGMGIRKIFNSRGVLDGGVDDNLSVGGLYPIINLGSMKDGNMVLIERSVSSKLGTNPLVTISVILFEDYPSMNIFVLNSGRIYHGEDVMLALAN